MLIYLPLGCCGCSVQSVRKIPVQDATQYIGLYCIVTFDKQQVLSDASMAKATTGQDGKLYISCEWTDIIKLCVSITSSLRPSSLCMHLTMFYLYHAPFLAFR